MSVEVWIAGGFGLGGIGLGWGLTFWTQWWWDRRQVERERKRSLRMAIQDAVVWSRRFQLGIVLRKPFEQEGAAENDVNLDTLISRVAEKYPKVKAAMTGLLMSNREDLERHLEGDLMKIQAWGAKHTDVATLLIEAADEEMGY